MEKIEKIEKMEKILVKFFDDGIDFEGFLIIHEKDMDKVLELLDKYRESDEAYNWDNFVQFLRENKIEFEKYIAEEVYF